MKQPPRHASTYRTARRAEYRSLVANGLKSSWPEFNAPKRIAGTDVRVGLPRTEYMGGAHFLGGRSKYNPHIGKKQMVKGAALIGAAS